MSENLEHLQTESHRPIPERKMRERSTRYDVYITSYFLRGVETDRRGRINSATSRDRRHARRAGTRLGGTRGVPASHALETGTPAVNHAVRAESGSRSVTTEVSVHPSVRLVSWLPPRPPPPRGFCGKTMRPPPHAGPANL